jgi:hypothetical protein
MKPTLRQVKPGSWAWTLKLGGRLPRGSYVLQVRAVDLIGNVSKSLAGKSRLSARR